MTEPVRAISGQIDRLAERVLAGEVAFFVGAGFSLDSESNSTRRLQARLLARFEALVEATGQRELRQKLIATFQLGKLVSSDEDSLLVQPVLEKLGAEYYALNDWMCAAFALLLSRLYGLPEPSVTLLQANQRENHLLSAHDKVAIEPIDLPNLQLVKDEAARGKALFLETLGFGSPSIMAGEPFDADILNVRASYRLRPRRRHEVLARLAREGLCPTLVTTNYDLLIEGAYRLAGFSARNERSDTMVAPTVVPHLAVVADPLEFFQQRDGSRTALVLKLHGCARLYRESKAQTIHDAKRLPPNARGRTRWERYLRAIVYTYREIQNWREDSWSRDFLCTLLRTRTLVLCGYSAADSVVHDTFRTVYEELARFREEAGPRPAIEPIAERIAEVAEDAPAFFFGPTRQWEFHGAEILRAATRAVGSRLPELASHPNYLQFQFVKPGAFPTMDDVFVWLFHRVMRLRQQRALQQDLRRVAAQLLLRSPTDSELTALQAAFKQLIDAEQAVARSLGPDAPRSRFSSMVDWTDQFHVAFLRQLALTDALARREGSRQQVDVLRRVPTWYFPISDQPDWGAWAVVVELAVRRLLASALSVDDWRQLPASVTVHAWEGVPTLTWRRQQRTAALAMRWEGDPLRNRHTFPGSPRQRRVWQQRSDALPWTRAQSLQGSPSLAPNAREVWEIALNGIDSDRAIGWLEEREEKDVGRPGGARASSKEVQP